MKCFKFLIADSNPFCRILFFDHHSGVLLVGPNFLSMPSTVVSTIEYDPEHQVLTITFRSGKIYYYKDVPEKVYLSLRSSRSKGRFLNQSIKGSYDYETFDG